MGVEFRAVTPDQFPDFVQAMGFAFHFDPPEDDHFEHLLSFDRTFAGFDGERMVSTISAFPLQMTIPGAVVPCGGTTVVSVAPTHRRQGVMKAMMLRHLEDVREHEEPIAALWASDSAIYGRFGFGMAAVGYDLEILREHVEFHRLAPSPAPVRVIEATDAQAALSPFYDRLRRSIPGFYERTPAWWEHRVLVDEKHRRQGATKLRFAVADGPDGVDGYVQYRVKSDWENHHGAATIKVIDLFGTTPESWAAIWAYVLRHDLASRVTAEHRSGQDPVFDLLAGTRRARADRADTLWVRLMDVPRALTARSYSAPVDIVIEVRDAFGDTSGRYKLSASTEGSECSPTDSDPDISLDAEDLGAIYMGRSRLQSLARAGRLAGDRKLLATVDAAFDWDPQPWCPEVF